MATATVTEYTAFPGVVQIDVLLSSAEQIGKIERREHKNPFAWHLVNKESDYPIAYQAGGVIKFDYHAAWGLNTYRITIESASTGSVSQIIEEPVTLAFTEVVLQNATHYSWGARLDSILTDSFDLTRHNVVHDIPERTTGPLVTYREGGVTTRTLSILAGFGTVPQSIVLTQLKRTGEFMLRRPDSTPDYRGPIMSSRFTHGPVSDDPTATAWFLALTLTEDS